MKTIFVITSLLIIQAFYLRPVQAQSYEALTSQKVVINLDDHTIVTYTRPRGRISTHNDCSYYWLSGQSIHVTQGGFSGKLLNGSYESFYLNKNLKESGNFLDGVKIGEWKNWTDQGVLTDQYIWKAGKKNGKYRKFSPEGKEIEYGCYQNDLLHGKQVIVGDSLHVIHYKHGKVIQRRQFLPGFMNKIIHLSKSAQSD